METKAGEWYWGAECPHCKEMAVHTHDPMRGKGDVKAPGGGRMECPTDMGLTPQPKTWSDLSGGRNKSIGDGAACPLRFDSLRDAIDELHYLGQGAPSAAPAT